MFQSGINALCVALCCYLYPWVMEAIGHRSYFLFIDNLMFRKRKLHTFLEAESFFLPRLSSRNNLKCLYDVECKFLGDFSFYCNLPIYHDQLNSRGTFLFIVLMVFPFFPLKGLCPSLSSLGKYHSTDYLKMYLNCKTHIKVLFTEKNHKVI